MENSSYSNEKRHIFFVSLLLALVLFSSSHYLFYSQEINFDRSVDVFEAMASEGSIIRRISLFSLAVLSIVSLMGRQKYRLKMGGALSWSLLFFGVWAFASFLWSIDTGLTVRRLIVLFIFSLAGLAMAGRFSNKLMPLCLFFISGLYLFLGISVEIVLGTFQPFSADYRFAGTLHPNIQGINCALLFLSAVYLAQHSHKKSFFLLIASVAFTFLIFTGSRTSFAGALLAQIFTCVAFRRSKTILFLLACFWSFGFLYIIFENNLFSLAAQSILLGRGADEITTLTGRTILWEDFIDYIGVRPVTGYGFGAFWSTQHIQEFSRIAGIGIIDAHSVYLELSLNLGIVGLISYIFIMSFGIAKAIKNRNINNSGSYGFLFTILIFVLLHGILESAVMGFTLPISFILLWGLMDLALKKCEQAANIEGMPAENLPVSTSPRFSFF